MISEQPTSTFLSPDFVMRQLKYSRQDRQLVLFELLASSKIHGGSPLNSSDQKTNKHDSSAILIDYFIESASYGFLFTSCKTLENERVSAANE